MSSKSAPPNYGLEFCSTKLWWFYLPHPTSPFQKLDSQTRMPHVHGIQPPPPQTPIAEHSTPQTCDWKGRLECEPLREVRRPEPSGCDNTYNYKCVRPVESSTTCPCLIDCLRGGFPDLPPSYFGALLKSQAINHRSMLKPKCDIKTEGTHMGKMWETRRLHVL